MSLILCFLVYNKRLITEPTSSGCNENEINFYIKSKSALSNRQLLGIIFAIIFKKHLLKRHSLCAFDSMRSWYMNWKKRDTYVFRARSGCRRWRWSRSATEFRCEAFSSSSPGIVLHWTSCFGKYISPAPVTLLLEFPLCKPLLHLRREFTKSSDFLSSDQDILLHLDQFFGNLHLHIT